MKKILSLVLCLTFITPTNAFAEQAQPEPIQDEYYIPLRDAFETNGGIVSWSNEENRVLIKKDNTNYSLSAVDQVFTTNDKKTDLKFPIINNNGKIYIHYDDVAFLYENENDIYKNTKKEITVFIYDLIESYELTGITFAFVDAKTGYVWEQGFGKASDTQPVTADTLFNIGSISKSFTALGVLKLVEEGKLDLDKPVVTYIPELSLKTNPIYGGNIKDVTVRMLLSHFSGINGDIFDDIYSANNYSKDYMNYYINNLSDEYMTAEPAKRYSYSNSGYALLGSLIAKTSGSDNIFDGFVNYIDKEVIKNIGLQNSAFALTEQNENIAKSYVKSNTPTMEALYFNNLPAGGLYSNAKDMSKFMSFILNDGNVDGKQVFKKDSIQSMLKTAPYNDLLNTTMRLGLGSYKTPYKDGEYTGHGGNVKYFNSDYQLSLDAGLGVFASSNCSTSMSVVSSITIVAQEYALGESGRTADIAVKNQNIANAIPTTDLSGHYLGLGDLHVTDKGDIIFDELTLSLSDKGMYNNEVIGDVSFLNIDGVDVIATENAILSQKIDIVPADATFTKYIGDYKAIKKPNEIGLFDEISFDVDKNNYPVIIISVEVGGNKISSPLPLKKIDENTFVILGIGRNLGTVITVINIKDKNYIKYNGVLYE